MKLPFFVVFFPTVLCVCVLFFFSVTAVAERTPFFTVSDDAAVLLSGDTGNAYTAAASVSVTEPFTGDIYALAEDLQVTDTVAGDIGFVGSTATISESVDGDVRVIGDSFTIDGVVSGEALFLGSRVTVSKNGSVLGRLVTAADFVVINGTVGGDVLCFSCTDLIIHGRVDGSIYASSVESITVHPGAVVGGAIQYASPHEDALFVFPGATVSGDTEFTLKGVDRSSVSTVVSRLVFVLAVGLLAYGLVRHRWDRYLRVRPFRAVLDVLIGFVSFLAAVVISFILLFVPGLFIIGAALFFSCIALLLCGIISSPVLVGFVVQSLYRKGAGVSWQSVFLGAGVLFLALFVPVLGSGIIALCALFCVGRVVRYAYSCCVRQCSDA